MKKLLFLTVLLCVNLVSFSQKFPVPDGKLKAEQICGGKCQPGGVGTIFLFTKKLYSPDIDDKSSTKSVAYSILGHVTPSEDFYGDMINTCDTTSLNPFSMDDITNLGSTGRSIDYKRTSKLNINIAAAVKANLDELKKFTTDTTKLLKLEATIKASYARINNKELTVVGSYSEWVLKQNAIEHLSKHDGFPKCVTFPKNS